MADQELPRTFLAILPKPVRTHLLELGRERRVAKGEVILHQGADGSHVVLIRRGLAKVTASTPDGRSTLLAIRVSGDIVGEMAALNGHPRSATVTACSRTLVRVVPEKEFRPFLKEHPEAAVYLAAMVADRLRYANRRRVDYASCTTRVRLARILAEMAVAHGRTTPAGLEIGVPLSQPELAGLCGAAEITVQKALRELRDDHLVATGYRRIVVLDLPALEAVADP